VGGGGAVGVQAVLSRALGAMLAGMRKQAAQLVVDDSLGLLDPAATSRIPVACSPRTAAVRSSAAEARARGSLMPHAEVAIVPGSHGGFNRINELNDRIAAFIKAHATGEQAAQPAQPPTAKR
jgi:hypothetical protein